MALLFVALVVFVSGCISGNTIKRQAAEPSDNATNISLADYEDNAPEATACDCPDSFRTCGDGFNTTCENSCTNGTCSRCVPDCTGHSLCNESWFCGEWQPCSGSTQTRRCIDSSFCNKTAVIETRNCPDSCSSDADCPTWTGCKIYFCEGSPKACKTYDKIPCCGDGRCEGDGDCISDCPPAPCNCSQAQCQPCNETTQQNQSQQTSWQVIISEVMYNPSTTQGDDNYNEWIELYNPTAYNADMTNWTLCGKTLLSGYVSRRDNQTHATSLLILAAASHALVTDGGTGTEVYDKFNVSANTLTLYVDANSLCGGLPNTAGNITLEYPNTSIADYAYYNNSLGANGNNKTLERAGGSWAESTHNGGTPGY